MQAYTGAHASLHWCPCERTLAPLALSTDLCPPLRMPPARPRVPGWQCWKVDASHTERVTRTSSHEVQLLASMFILAKAMGRGYRGNVPPLRSQLL